MENKFPCHPQAHHCVNYYNIKLLFWNHTEQKNNSRHWLFNCWPHFVQYFFWTLAQTSLYALLLSWNNFGLWSSRYNNHFRCCCLLEHKQLQGVQGHPKVPNPLLNLCSCSCQETAHNLLHAIVKFDKNSHRRSLYMFRCHWLFYGTEVFWWHIKKSHFTFPFVQWCFLFLEEHTI